MTQDHPEPRPTVPESGEKRITPRTAARLRVDARLVRPEERHALMAGQGFAELDDEALSLSRPRHGLTRLESRDVSASGLRLKVQGLEGVSTGKGLCLDVHLPGDRRVVKLLGEVVWTGESAGEPVAGVRMASLAQEGLRRLLGLLG